MSAAEPPVTVMVHEYDGEPCVAVDASDLPDQRTICVEHGWLLIEVYTQPMYPPPTDDLG